MNPTQAQIEAALQKEREDIVSVIRSTTWSGSEEIVSMIRNRKAALTAAAEVGEQEWQRGYEAGMKSAAPAIYVLQKNAREIEAATIERCAQMDRALTINMLEQIIDIWSMRPPPLSNEGRAWEEGARHGWEWAIERFAAAIRALQDKPPTDPNIIYPGKNLTNVLL